MEEKDILNLETLNKGACAVRKRCCENSPEEPPRKTVEIDVSGQTKLHHAVKCKDATAVLAISANESDLVGVQDKFGQTALHVAARWGYADIGRTLLARGACTHVQDRFGRTPLHLAVIWGRWAAAEVICDNEETNRLQDRKGRTALYYATERGCEGIVQKLLSARARESLIERVAESIKDVKLVDVQDNDGDTALHMAARGGHTKIVEMLLAAGACTRVQNRLGRTPLQLALKCRRQGAADVLCDNDDDSYDLQDKGGRTALHYAAKNGQAGIVRKLLFLDAHPHLMDNQGKSPLEFALKRGEDHLVKLIMSSVVLKDIIIDWKDLKVDRGDVEYCARLEAECITELQHMKGMKIDRTTISYHDVVKKRVSKVAVYLENDDVTNAALLRGGAAAQVFPSYAERIGFRVGKAAVRNMLTDQCHECFAMLPRKFSCIPRGSIDKIFEFLSEREMQNFIKAFSCLKD